MTFFKYNTLIRFNGRLGLKLWVFLILFVGKYFLIVTLTYWVLINEVTLSIKIRNEFALDVMNKNVKK